ncbi:MAG: CHAP domain-containing protein [Frankia sp.]|nr:CHAP domain-containing protein [Frankia sp.]
MRALLRPFAAALLTTLMTAGLAAGAAPALAAGDDYPWRTARLTAVDPWGFTARQCTSFAAWRLAQHQAVRAVVGWGNAAAWDERARGAGLRISSTPKAGAIAQWNGGETSRWVAGTSSGTFVAGAAGHVAWVSGVYANGLVRLEAYNASGTRSYGVIAGRAPRYIYLR